MYPMLWNWMELEDEITSNTLSAVMTNDVTVFNYLHDFEWNPDEVSAFDYHILFISEYGSRIISPLSSRFVSEYSNKFTNNSAMLLGRMITRRYQVKWDNLFNQYSRLSGLMNNVSLSTTHEETQSNVHEGDAQETSTISNSRNEIMSGSRSKDTSDSGISSESGSRDSFESKESSDSESTSDTRVMSGGHTDSVSSSESNSNIRSGSMATKDSGTTAESAIHEGSKVTRIDRSGSVADTTESSGTDSVWGFNSTNAVPSNTNIANDVTSRATSDSGTTTETPSLRDSTTTSHGKSTTTDYSNLTDASSGILESKSTRLYDSESETRSKAGLVTRSDSGSTTTTDSKSSSTSRSVGEKESNSNSKVFSGRESASKNQQDNWNEVKESSYSENTSGYNIRRLTDKKEMYEFMLSSPLFSDFFRVIFNDIASMLTISVFE